MQRLASLAALFSLAACEPTALPTFAKEARAVTAAVVNEDLQAWGELASPNLLQQMKTNDFRRVAATLRQLGPLQNVALVQHAWIEGQRATVHHLRFEQGQARLSATYDARGRIDALLFDGDDVQAAQARAQREAASEFTVQRLVWLLDQETPNPRGNRFNVGDTVGIGLVVSGLAAANDEHHVVIDLAVRHPQGQVLYEAQGFLDQRFAVHPQGIPRGSLYAALRAPVAGEMQLELTIKDEVAGKSLTHRAALIVDGP